jgi:hypothetical protein
LHSAESESRSIVPFLHKGHSRGFVDHEARMRAVRVPPFRGSPLQTDKALTIR